MRMDKLTSRFQQALADAQSLAVGADHSQIEPAHLLHALLQQAEGVAAPLLQQAGARLDAVQAALQQQLAAIATLQQPTGEVTVGNELARLLNLTDKLAQQRKDQFISSELWLLALVQDKCALGQLLRDAGADARRLEQAIAQLRGGANVDTAGAEDQRQKRPRQADVENDDARGRVSGTDERHHHIDHRNANRTDRQRGKKTRRGQSSQPGEQQTVPHAPPRPPQPLQRRPA